MSNKNASKIRYVRTLVERTPIGTTGLVQLNFILNLISTNYISPLKVIYIPLRQSVIRLCIKHY